MITFLYLQHAHTLGNSFVLHFVEYETAHIKQADRGVGGEWFLHIGIDYTVGIIDLGNAQMIFVLRQVMINRILFPKNKQIL